MASDELLFQVSDRIATVTLNRPEALNALTQTMLDEFDRLWDRVDADDEVRAVVVTGAGRGFCSGIDLKQTDMADRKRGRPSFDYASQWTARIQRVSKPIIAAVNGVAAGGGLGLALACDIRIASDRARFSAIFANIGMPVLDGVGGMLPQAVGLSKALELIFTADIIDAPEAQRIGLVSYTVPHDELMERATELARKIAAGPPMAIAMSKHVVYNALGRGFVDHLVYQNLAILANATYASHDIAEGGRAFRERRKPEFRGPVADDGGVGTQ
ncbi:MAG: enoyl-CoA hydratase/isomerase family protein [Dehalococcoidia bacterium]